MKRKLILPWLIGSWAEFLSLSIVVIIGVAGDTQWLVEGILTFIILGLIYYVVLRHYQSMFVEDSYDMEYKSYTNNQDL